MVSADGGSLLQILAYRHRADRERERRRRRSAARPSRRRIAGLRPAGPDPDRDRGLRARAQRLSAMPAAAAPNSCSMPTTSAAALRRSHLRQRTRASRTCSSFSMASIARRTGWGVGLIGARRLMDTFNIDSKPGKGTTVEVGHMLPGRLDAMAPRQADRNRIQPEEGNRRPTRWPRCASRTAS